MKYFSSTLTQGLQSCQIASPTNRKWCLRKCGNNTDKEIEKGVFTLKAGTLAEQGMQSLRNQREKRPLYIERNKVKDGSRFFM